MLMHLTLVLVLVRVILNGAEALANRNDYAALGVVPGPMRPKTRQWLSNSARSRALNARPQQTAQLLAIVLQLICALVLLLPSARFMTAPLLALLLAFEFLIPAGNLGGEGSDQMHFIVLCAITIFYCTTDSLARSAVVWFVALQSMLAYFTSGAVKLKTLPWKQGKAISLVLSTDSYGNRRLYKLLERAPRISKFICWGTILFECGFPFAVLAGPKSALFVLSCGVFFHFTIAAVMGLNGFFWTFIATYPAIFEFSRDLQQLIHTRIQ